MSASSAFPRRGPADSSHAGNALHTCVSAQFAICSFHFALFNSTDAHSTRDRRKPVRQRTPTMQLVTQLTPADLEHVASLDSFVPREIFDAHTHLFHTRHFAEGKRPVFLPENTPFGLAEYHAALARWMPGRKVEGLFFPYPSKGNDRRGENAFIAGEMAKRDPSSPTRALALAAPEDDPGYLRELLESKTFV